VDEEQTLVRRRKHGYIRCRNGIESQMRESLLLALDAGLIPYKAPYWAVEEMTRRSDPGQVELLIRVKRMLDPSKIMNPGRYGDTRG
jgi:hypothetical protein